MTDLEVHPFEPQYFDVVTPRLVPRFDPETATQAREFSTGATRSSDEGKIDLEGALSPLVLFEYGRYMLETATTPEGTRDSDNWQKGIPTEAYMKSAYRHFLAVWLKHRGHQRGDIIKDLMALMFNIQGMAHELIKERNNGN